MNSDTIKVATFGAGCFWGIEEAFRTTKGVVETEVGFMGGVTESPSYEDVSHKKTVHAEVVQVMFDPEIISYSKLLGVFWKNHDPTELNRQGPDIGEQYRSVIFYHTPEQREISEDSKTNLHKSGKYSVPIVTEIVPSSRFYKAEEHHQKYLMKRGLKTC